MLLQVVLCYVKSIDDTEANANQCKGCNISTAHSNDSLHRCDTDVFPIHISGFGSSLVTKVFSSTFTEEATEDLLESRYKGRRLLAPDNELLSFLRCDYYDGCADEVLFLTFNRSEGFSISFYQLLCIVELAFNLLQIKLLLTDKVDSDLRWLN